MSIFYAKHVYASSIQIALSPTVSILSINAIKLFSIE